MTWELQMENIPKNKNISKKTVVGKCLSQSKTVADNCQRQPVVVNGQWGGGSTWLYGWHVTNVDYGLRGQRWTWHMVDNMVDMENDDLLLTLHELFGIYNSLVLEIFQHLKHIFTKIYNQLYLIKNLFFSKNKLFSFCI